MSLQIDPQCSTSNEHDLKWYCGLALQAMIAKQGIPESESAREEIALWAYRMAEEMVHTVNRLNRSKSEREQHVQP